MAKKASPKRDEILRLLGNRAWTGTELAEFLGRHQTTVAADLRRLYQAGLVARRHNGNKIYYLRPVNR